MPRRTANGTGANLGFEAKLWTMADELRGSMDSGEYKHVVLGLIFLKYISDRFEQRHAQLVQEVANPSSDNCIIEPDERDSFVEDRGATPTTSPSRSRRSISAPIATSRARGVRIC
jgi:type I restriction-modification system DNA methylase subunit